MPARCVKAISSSVEPPCPRDQPLSHMAMPRTVAMLHLTVNVPALYIHHCSTALLHHCSTGSLLQVVHRGILAWVGAPPKGRDVLPLRSFGVYGLSCFTLDTLVTTVYDLAKAQLLSHMVTDRLTL